MRFRKNNFSIHRAGPRSDAKPRAIICKFVYRPERFKVIRKKRDLSDGVWITEDLIWEDREKKKKLKDVMKEAFESGKKPLYSFPTMESRLFSTLKRFLHHIFELLLLLPILPDQILRYPNTITEVAFLPNDFEPLWTIYKFTNIASFAHNEFRPHRFAQNENGFAQK